jgi:hypothetical protein
MSLAVHRSVWGWGCVSHSAVPANPTTAVALRVGGGEGGGEGGSVEPDGVEEAPKKRKGILGLLGLLGVLSVVGIIPASMSLLLRTSDFHAFTLEFPIQVSRGTCRSRPVAVHS